MARKHGTRRNPPMTCKEPGEWKTDDGRFRLVWRKRTRRWVLTPLSLGSPVPPEERYRISIGTLREGQLRILDILELEKLAGT